MDHSNSTYLISRLKIAMTAENFRVEFDPVGKKMERTMMSLKIPKASTSNAQITGGKKLVMILAILAPQQRSRSIPRT